MFVWVFHRVSGLILIALLAFKIVTGYGILGRFGDTSIEQMRHLHRLISLDLLTVGLFIYHGLYGVRTCLIDLGMRQEKGLFWILTGFGALLFAVIARWLILASPVV